MSTQSFTASITYIRCSDSSFPPQLDRLPFATKTNRLSLFSLSRPKSTKGKNREQLWSKQPLRSVSSPTRSEPLSPASISTPSTAGPSKLRYQPSTPRLRHSKSTSIFETTIQHAPPLPTQPSTGIWVKGKIRVHVVTAKGSKSIDLNVVDEEGGIVFQHVGHLDRPQSSLIFELVHPSIVHGRHVLRVKTSAIEWLYLAFDSQTSLNEWQGLLHIISPLRPGWTSRRLHIDCLDLGEMEPILQEDLDGHGSLASAAESSATVRSQGRRPGWSMRGQLAIEVLLDGAMVARTGWAESVHGMKPFWGETVNLENLQPFSSCGLRIYRRRKNKTEYIGDAPLALVPDHSYRHDERYPLYERETGTIMGEIRVAANLMEATPGERDKELVDPIVRPNDLSHLYWRHRSGDLRHVGGLCARIGLAEGSLQSQLVAMVSLEVKSVEPDTLFRSNSPLSFLLQATIRILCQAFLRASLGPTIERVLDLTLVPSDGELGSLASQCLDDICAQRVMFPYVLRDVFAALASDLSRRFSDTRLVHRAVASFIFLRLIDPSLLQPHNYGLALHPLPDQSAGRLKAVAKTLHSVAFLTDEPAKKEAEPVYPFDVLKAMRPTMESFLDFVTTPERDHSIPSPIGAFITAYRSSAPLELAGLLPVVIQGEILLTVADKAHLAATLSACASCSYVSDRSSTDVPERTLRSPIAESTSSGLSRLSDARHRPTLQLDPPTPFRQSPSLREKMTSPLATFFSRNKKSRDRSATVPTSSHARIASD